MKRESDSDSHRNSQSHGPRRFKHGGTVLLALGVAAALLVATRVSRVLFERPTHAPHEAGAAGPDSGAEGDDGAIFQVTTAAGQVDVFRDGRWIAVQPGDRLTRDDLVRTVPDARAVLRLASGTEVELREKVEIRLDRLSAAGASLDLRRGKVVARVASAAEALAITARETRTSSDGPAHFVVLADEHGQVSVATLKGKARFAAAGRTVLVPAGSQTSSRLGEPPTDPEQVPEAVLLQVVWPSGERHGDTTAVEGRVAPTSTVTVNGTPAAVAPDGRFTATIPLRDGTNLLRVDAEDLAGRTGRSSTTLVRRSTRPPRLAPEPAELWKK